jgi:hypothetical protein
MSEAAWRSACQASLTRPLDEKLQQLYASGGAEVRMTLPVRACDATDVHSQIVFCLLCFAIGFVMMVRWRSIADPQRAVLWQSYGTLNALACAAAGASIAETSFNMVFLSNLFTAEDPLIASTQSSAARHRNFYAPASIAYAGFMMCYSLHFLIVCFAKLLVLFRLLGFAAGVAKLQRKAAVIRRLRIVRILLLVFVSVVCVTGCAACVIVAVDYSQLSALQLSLAAALERNITMPGYSAAAGGLLESGARWAGVMTTCEVVVLPVIIAAFAMTGLYCTRIRVVMQSSSEPSSIESNETNQVKMQVAITVSLVFVTLLVRAAYSFILAYASFTSAIVQTPACVADGALDNACTNECRTVGFVIKNWMLYTPTFRSLAHRDAQHPVLFGFQSHSPPPLPLPSLQSLCVYHCIACCSYYLHLGHDQLACTSRND